LQTVRSFLIALLAIAAVLLAWQAAVAALNAPQWLAPSPIMVWTTFLKNRPMIMTQIASTGLAALGGLVVGSLLGILLAVAMDQWKRLERILMPILIIDQSIPKVAVAPLVVIWFGAGISSRIAIAVVVSFFPMIVSTLRGLRSMDQRLGRLMHTVSATRLETLIKVRLPNATPHIFSALKIAAPLAVTGAIVAEYVQSNSGLGYLIMLAMTEFNTPMIFVAVVAAAILSLVLYGAATLLPMLLFGRRSAVLLQAHSRQ
jgi:NitT/TauT family transport system permease protein